MTTRIRPVNPQDAEVLAHHAYWRDTDAGMRPVFAAWVQDALQRGLYLGFVADNGHEVVAGAGLLLLEWGPSRDDPLPYRARIKNVWTHPDYRRRGLARPLVTCCLDEAGRRGITRLSLGATEMGRPLYEQLGFRASTTEMTLHLPLTDSALG